MSIQYSVEILPGFEKALLQAAQKQIVRRIRAVAQSIKTDVQDLIRSRIESSETWLSLDNGALRGELGVNHSRLTAILDMFVKSVSITVAPTVVGKEIQNVLVIEAIENSYLTYTESTAAIIKSNEYIVPWLRWLLLSGTALVVGNFHVETNLSAEQKAHSRTGDAIMVAGGFYRVPPEHAGIQTNNFVTRALDGIENDIINVLKRNIG